MSAATNATNITSKAAVEEIAERLTDMADQAETEPHFQIGADYEIAALRDAAASLREQESKITKLTAALAVALDQMESSAAAAMRKLLE